MARHAASVIQGALAVVLFQMRSAAVMEFIVALKVIFVTMVVGVAERVEANSFSTFLNEMYVKKKTRSKYFWGILLDNMGRLVKEISSVLDFILR